MNVCAYHRGNDIEEFGAAVRACALDRGAAVSELLYDEPPAVAAFRRLQNYVKLGLCQCVIVKNRRSLGDDDWLILENELFFRRNGVRLVYLEKPQRDRRYGLANAVKAYYMPLRDWAVRHGDELPMDYRAADERRLPFGYTVENGNIVPDGERAERVIRLFTDYASGMDAESAARRFFEDDTPGQRIYDILSNGRYAGLGANLPGIVSFDIRSRTAQRRGTRKAAPLKPFFGVTSADTPYRYTRTGAGRANGVCTVDSDKLEESLAEFIASLAKGGAEAFYEQYVLPRRSEAELALPKAEKANAEAKREYERLVNELCAGERDELPDVANDAAFLAGIRLRRVQTELELFSITPDEINGFFTRARVLDLLSREEKEFLAKAFLRSLRIKDGTLTAVGICPASGKLVKKEINEVLK